MALDFPNSPPPVEGQIYVGANGITYVFDGVKWNGQMPTGGGTEGGGSGAGGAGRVQFTYW